MSNHQVKDFRVKVSVRSARLLDLIEDKFGSQAEFHRRSGVSMSQINALVTMRSLPVGADGDWSGPAESIASALGVYPSDIWPEHIREVRLKQSTGEVRLDAHEVQAIASGGQVEMRMLLAKATGRLTARQVQVVASRAQGETLDDVARELGVTSVRVRQIEIKAQRKMREDMARLGVRSFQDAIE